MEKSKKSENSVEVKTDVKKDKVRGPRSTAATSNLVKPHGNKLLPSGFANSDELSDRLLVHTHGIVNGELISRHALLDVTRSIHTRNVRDARERRAVVSYRRSAMKRDGASTT
jgi:hypothetical protein